MAVIAGAATGQPEVIAGGVALYNVGDRMEDVSTAIELSSNVADKNFTEFTKNALGTAASKTVGKAIGGTKLNEGTKTVLDYISGNTIDKVKNAGNKNESSTEK